MQRSVDKPPPADSSRSSQPPSQRDIASSADRARNHRSPIKLSSVGPTRTKYRRPRYNGGSLQSSWRFSAACACRASTHTTERPTRRSSCQSQLDIAPVSKPIRSALGALLRQRAWIGFGGARIDSVSRFVEHTYRGFLLRDIESYVLLHGSPSFGSIA